MHHVRMNIYGYNRKRKILREQIFPYPSLPCESFHLFVLLCLLHYVDQRKNTRLTQFKIIWLEILLCFELNFNSSTLFFLA